MKRTGLLSALLVTLIISALLDQGYSLLKRAGAALPGSGQELDMLRLRLAGDILANILMAGVLLGLAWLVLVKSAKDPVVAWLYLVAGLLALLYLPLVLVGPPGLVGFLTSSPVGVVTRGFRMALMEKGFTTYFGLAGAGVFLVGLLALFYDRHYPARQAETRATNSN